MTDADDPQQLDEILSALAGLRGGGRRTGGPFGHLGDHRSPHDAETHEGHGRDPRSHGQWPEPRGHQGPGGFGRIADDGEHGRGGGRGRHGPWPPPFGPGGPARLRLLEALASASTPLSVSEVAERIGVDQPRASRLVQQSVELGVVRREADPDDARRTRIVLTDEGLRLVRGFRGRRRDQLERALGGFTAAERTELARLLAKLAAAWPR